MRRIALVGRWLATGRLGSGVERRPEIALRFVTRQSISHRGAVKDYRQFDQDQNLRLYERHEFSKGKSNPLGNGEYYFVSRTFCSEFGRGQNGSRRECAIYNENVITVRSIEFNRPESCVVYDRIPRRKPSWSSMTIAS